MKEISTKIINIFGSNGVGKSLISILISKKIADKKLKVLLIDNDKINKSIFQILGIKNNKLNNKYNFKIINNEEKNKKLNNYDWIIYDNPNIKKININNIHKSINIFICESNLLGIKKTLNLIKINNKIKNNIFIIFNKYNFNSINFEILKNIFNNNYNILGKINYSNKIEIIINKNKLIKIKSLEKEIDKIIKKLLDKK